MKLDKVFFKVLLIAVLTFEGPDCLMYSLENNGPCINGGNLTCKGDEVGPQITCKCPPYYKGMFCEEKSKNVNQIFFNTSVFSIKLCENLSITHLEGCHYHNLIKF